MPAAPIVPDDLRTKLLRVRALVLDVDGVLTDGTLTFDEDGRELKSFDVKDGLGLVLLRDLGYRIGLISSRSSKVVSMRCRDLKIPEEEIWQGSFDGVGDDSDAIAERLEQLKARRPGFRWDRVPVRPTRSDLPRLITVGTVVEYLEKRLSGGAASPE